MRISHVTALAAACDVTASWLAFGEGPVTPEARNTEEFLVTEQRLTRIDVPAAMPRETVSTTPRSGVERNENVGYLPIPRYNVEASAGGGALVHSEQIVDFIAFSPDFLRTEIRRKPEQLLLITARGDSMEPTIRDGELLLLDISPQPIASGAIHVINVDGTLLVKRLEVCVDASVLIHSDNSRYKMQSVPKSERDKLNIIGQVVWQGGPVRS